MCPHNCFTNILYEMLCTDCLATKEHTPEEPDKHNNIAYTQALIWHSRASCSQCQSGITGPFHKKCNKNSEALLALCLSWQWDHEQKQSESYDYWCFIVVTVLELWTQCLFSVLQILFPAHVWRQANEKGLNPRPAEELL